MATVTTSSSVDHVGETAGTVWHALKEQGPMTLAKLVRELGLSRDRASLAVGWLAREDKIAIEESGRRGLIISLRLE